MTSTVENISNNINTQLLIINNILNLLNEYDLDKTNSKTIELYRKSLNELSDQYISSAATLLSNYYLATLEIERKKIYNLYVQMYHSIKLVSVLKKIYQFITRVRKVYDFTNDDLDLLCKKFESIIIDETFVNVCPDICSNCKKKYSIEEKTAEFTCKTCGYVEKMDGAVFAEDQFFYQEGQRTKHGRYEPIRHAKFWLDNIQAKESKTIPEPLIEKIRSCISKDGIWPLERVSCENIREYLKQLGKTTYNNHITLIRKLVTGIEPEQLTDLETQQIYLYFSKVIQIYNKIKKSPNCPYHPFFIYKIIEQILKNPTDVNRKKSILGCIHLQSRSTLVDKDEIWFNICNEIPEFTKIATNSNIR